MKYKTFRNIVATVVVLGAIAGLGTCAKCAGDASARRDEERRREEVAARARDDELAAQVAAQAEARREEERQAQERQAAETTQRLANPVAFVASAPGLRPSDADVLEALQRPVTDKIKDATRGKAWKVNLYADDKQRFNRAKVDLDRDDKWDESWTVKADGTVEKKVAANDDEKYGPPMRLDRASGWVSLADATAATAAAAATPAATTATTATAATGATATGDALSPADREVLALVAARTPTEKIKDATKGKSFKVNLYSDDGARWNRAKVDLDRDDKWDESWTFKDGTTEKKVAPRDDENYTDTLTLAGEAWRKN